MAKKTTKTKKRYQDGGEIVVTGTRPGGNTNPMGAIPASYALPPESTKTQRLTSMGSAGPDQRISNLKPPVTPRTSMPVTPTVVRQPQSSLGQIVGARAPSALGARGRFSFAEGGEAKAKKKPAKKMAKGGKVSSASKRADGCAVKGKTRGKMV